MKSKERARIAIPSVNRADRLGTVAAEFAPFTTRNDSNLNNVILLSRHRRIGETETPPPATAEKQAAAPAISLPEQCSDDAAAPAIEVSAEERPSPASQEQRARRMPLLLSALLLHLAVLAFLLRDPPPLASVGLESISVEIVLGADTPAGLASTPSEFESAPSEAAEETLKEAETVQKEPEPEQQQPVAEETPAEEKPVEETPNEPPPTEVAAQPEPAPEPEPVPEPEPTPEPKPAETQAVIVPEKPVTPPVKPEPKVTEKPRPKKTVPKRTASAPSSAASSGIGEGRSSLDRNYPGMVAAHLARHKRFPPEARASGNGGTATVSFSLDGSGRVTSVRLSRSSGVASLDAETQAMVRRASPFPAPPSGRTMSFTVPVNFNLR